MAIIIGIDKSGIIDAYQPPIDPQFIGGIRDGDGDTGHVDPLPFEFRTNEESPE